MSIYLKSLRLFIILIIGVLFLLGSGSNDNSDKSELIIYRDRPIFTSPDEINFTENSTESIIITATDLSNLSFEINGEDRKYFRIYTNPNSNQNQSSAILDFLNAPDYETKKVYRLTIIADDGFPNNKITQELTINIVDVDETAIDTIPPKFSSSKKTFTIDENKILIGKVIATDINRINYYISGGKDASSFTINSSTGTLEFKVAPNYEVKTSYEVKVTAEDSEKNKSVQIVTINIRNVDESITDTTPPILILPKIIKVYENETYVIRVEATDINSIQYSISGIDANSFTIDSITGILQFKVAPDYEKRTVYYLDIIATDSKGNFKKEPNIKITILNVTEPTIDNTPPTFTSLSSVSVNENQTSAIILRATDNNSITYSISGTDASYFNVGSSTGVITFKIAPDYESKNFYTFTAKATDSKGNSQTQTVSINIVDLYEEIVDNTPPIFTSSSSVSVNENQTSAIILRATDNNSITYSISGTDASYFNVGSSTGVITFKIAPDYESKNFYTFTAKATDSKGNSQTQTVSINIIDLYEEIVDNTPPVFTSSSSVSVNENQTSAIILRATDNNSITYSISGTDASYFNVGSSTGVITFKIAPDYESKNFYTFTAKATDSKGNSQTQTVSINIVDLYEEPIPIISSFSPLMTYLNKNTVFTVTGSNLPITLEVFIPNCMYLTNIFHSSIEFKFSCTPTGSGGSENILIKDKPNGIIIDTFTITLPTSAFSLSLLKGVWKTDTYYYYFEDNGYYTVYNYTDYCYVKTTGYQFRYVDGGGYQLYKDNQAIGGTATMDIDNNIWTVTNSDSGNAIELSRENLFVDTFEANLCN